MNCGIAEGTIAILSICYTSNAKKLFITKCWVKSPTLSFIVLVSASNTLYSIALMIRVFDYIKKLLPEPDSSVFSVISLSHLELFRVIFEYLHLCANMRRTKPARWQTMPVTCWHCSVFLFAFFLLHVLFCFCWCTWMQ